MAEETHRDEETYERVLKDQLAKGADKRVAEGKAKSAAVLAYRKVHGAPERAPRKAAPAAPAGGNGGAAEPAAGAPAAVPAMAAAPMMAGAPAAAARIAPAPTGKPPTAAKPGQNEKHRLLALVPPEGIQRVEREQGDRVNVWPHLLAEEFVALLVVTAFLIIFSTFVNAPLLEHANPNLTPNPSKAPWYFMGLQELLRYFHPTIAGVMMPTVAIIGLIVTPYFDRNPSTKPGDRKLAITIFTMFIMFWAILVMIGSFFRGPAQNWVWPWTQGLFFDL